MGTDSKVKREVNNNYFHASVGDWDERNRRFSLSAKFQHRRNFRKRLSAAAYGSGSGQKHGAEARLRGVGRSYRVREAMWAKREDRHIEKWTQMYL